MKKVYFEDEKEAELFCRNISTITSPSEMELVNNCRQADRVILREIFELSLSRSMKRIKDLGYIKKSPVDEAEEMYNTFITKGYSLPNAEKLIKDQHEAIQYLKKQLGEINCSELADLPNVAEQKRFISNKYKEMIESGEIICECFLPWQ